MIHNALCILATAALLAGASAAQVEAGHGATARPAGSPAESAAQDGEHSFKRTMEMETDEFFIPAMKHHLEPHVLFVPQVSLDPAINKNLAFYNVNLFQLIAIALMVLVFVPVLSSFKTERAGVVVRVFRGWCHWLRDEVVYSLMGEENGKRFAPYFIFLFFFIAFMNVIGLVPGSVTATSTVFVTGALAAVTFAMMVGGGMMQQGPGNYIKHLLPAGLPFWLVPLMAVVELVGLFVKPFALTIRLFANMLAGHLLIISFVGLIFVFAKMMQLSPLSWATAIPTVGMAVFVNIIESFVVLLQAYIFLYLSVLFVQESLHPAH